jgi:hypothetical protein
MSANAIADHDPAQAVARACDVVAQALSQTPKRPEVISFFDEPTNTASHVVRDPASRRYGRVVLAEFVYGGKIAPSFPIDLRKPRRSAWILKTKLLSFLYWRMMLRSSEFDIRHRERRFAKAKVA